MLQLKLYWSKTHEIKSKYKFNLYFTFEIINIHNRSCRKLFFLPFLNPLFHYSNLLKVFNWPYTSQKTVCSHRISIVCSRRFSFKIKDQIILSELEGILKNNLSFFKLDSKALLVYHCAITSTKWWNMKVTLTLILLGDISIEITGRGLLYS